jgi:hypothetical protein
VPVQQRRPRRLASGAAPTYHLTSLTRSVASEGPWLDWWPEREQFRDFHALCFRELEIRKCAEHLTAAWGPHSGMAVIMSCYTEHGPVSLRAHAHLTPRRPSFVTQYHQVLNQGDRHVCMGDGPAGVRGAECLFKSGRGAPFKAQAVRAYRAARRRSALRIGFAPQGLAALC